MKILNYIDIFMPRYVRSFNIMEKFKNKKNILNISYEELINNTENTIVSILFFLNLEINRDLIRVAINDSSLKNFKLEEEKNNVKNLISNKVNTSFIRNIGLKNNMDELSLNEIEKIKKYLIQSNITFKKYN